MTQGLLYLLGTLLGWAGWIGLLVFVARLVARRKDVAGPAILAGLGLVVSRVLTGPGKGAWQLPLAWPVMPWTAWLAVATTALALFRFTQGHLALDRSERQSRFVAAAIWIGVAVLLVLLYGKDPANKIAILTGGIPLGWTGLAGLVALAVGATLLGGALSRTVEGRGRAKAGAAQIALVVGSIVFGLPFAFLVITSFKEEKDMSSQNGIVWIPKVTETRPFFDPKNPLYAGTYDGKRVEGGIIGTLQDGRVRVDIYRPLSIRGFTFEARKEELKLIPKQANVVDVKVGGTTRRGLVAEDLDNGDKRVVLDGDKKEIVANPSDVEAVRHPGLRWQNYTEAISFLPPETRSGLVYLKNSLFLVIMGVIGTVLSSAIVAYAFSRLSFPGRDTLFTVMLATMMLPGAVTLMPQFLIFRSLGWVDTLYPLWVPAFFAGAFNVFLLRQFFRGIPMELEDAAKIDGASYVRTFWSVMMPQIKPALAVIAVGTALGAWNNFLGPLIYVNSPENMPLAYALQLFQGDRGGEPGLLMAFTTLTVLPPLALFFAAQKFIIEGASLSGLGGR